MSLINCPECTKEISSTSTTCIHCGYTLVKKKSIVTTLKEHKKVLLIIAIISIIVLVFVSLLFSGLIGMSRAERAAIKDIRTLQEGLLNPNSIIIYDAYVNFNYDSKQVTYVYYGAQNKGGGITDDGVFISGKELQSNRDYEEAVDNNDNTKILENGDVVFVEMKIKSGSDDWIMLNPDKLQKLIK